MTVIDNVILGLKMPKGLLDPSRVEKEITELSEKYGLKVDPKAKIWQLSVGEQQRVEILKAFYRGVDVLILDEPTSVLTPKEVEDFFQSLRLMVKKGITIIIITHKLKEVIGVSDRVTVIRHGKIVSTLETNSTNKEELATLMVGRKLLFRLNKPSLEKGNVVLKVENLEALNDKGLPALTGVSFSVHEREIFGIAGVAGNGQTELGKIINGLHKATKGKVFINERDITNRSPSEIINQGVGNIPEGRIEVGLCLSLTVDQNLMLKDYSTPPFAKGLLLNNEEICQYCEKLISDFDVKTPSGDVPASTLSGGEPAETHTGP